MNEWLRSGAWEKQSTYSHSRTPFSSADRKSLLPNFFLVTAWKKGYKNCEQNSKRGWVRRGGGGLCVYVWWGGEVGEER